MDVREKLVELVHNARMNALWHNAQKPDEYITDMLMEDGVTVQEWISVKDRLPEEGEDVLTHRGSGYGVESLESVSRKYWENDLFSYYHVTHWMHLPQPPKGE